MVGGVDRLARAFVRSRWQTWCCKLRGSEAGTILFGSPAIGRRAPIPGKRSVDLASVPPSDDLLDVGHVALVCLAWSIGELASLLERPCVGQPREVKRDGTPPFSSIISGHAATDGPLYDSDMVPVRLCTLL